MLILVVSLLDGSFVTLLSLAWMAKDSGDWLVVRSSRVVCWGFACVYYYTVQFFRLVWSLLVLMRLVPQLMWLLPGSILPTVAGGGCTCGICAVARECCSRRLLFFQLVQVVLVPLEVADFAEDGCPQKDDGSGAFAQQNVSCNWQDPMGGSSGRATYFCSEHYALLNKGFCVSYLYRFLKESQ